MLTPLIHCSKIFFLPSPTLSPSTQIKAPASAKNGNDAETARASTTTLLHHSLLLLLNVCGTPLQTGLSLPPKPPLIPPVPPNFGSPKGLSNRNSLVVVEYWKKFLGLFGSRFCDSESPLECELECALVAWTGDGGAGSISIVSMKSSSLSVSRVVSIVRLIAPSRCPPLELSIFGAYDNSV